MDALKITFLGTSSGTPTRTRNVTSIALQLPESGRLWLLDCGEGTQHQILRTPLRLSQLERIFLTHLHGDHLYGLPGLLSSRALAQGGTTPVTLHGPSGLEDFIRVSLRASGGRLGYPMSVRTVADTGTVFEDDAVRVECAVVDHGPNIAAFAYAIIEADRPGRFDIEQARALGIPPGPIYGKLKDGETVTLADGRTIDGSRLVGPTRPGRRVVFSGDTIYCPALVALARDADVLIHEATYRDADRPLAERAHHSTAVMAARVAAEARVGTLLLTHFSPRYEADDGAGLGELLAEARAIHPRTELASDRMVFDVTASS